MTSSPPPRRWSRSSPSRAERGGGPSGPLRSSRSGGQSRAEGTAALVSLGISAALLTFLLVFSIGVDPSRPAPDPSADLVGVRVDGVRLDAFLPVTAEGPRPAVVVDGGAAEAEQLAARGYVAVTLRGPTDPHALSTAERWIRAHADVLGARAEDVTLL